jgi:hypothetical protein
MLPTNSIDIICMVAEKQRLHPINIYGLVFVIEAACFL